MRSFLFAACVVSGGAATIVAGCSSDSSPAAPVDAGADVVDDVMQVDANDGGIEQDPNVYPAQHQPIPVLTNNAKNPVLTSPKVVTVTFTGDGRRDSYRAFDDTILTTPWWTAAIGGIGVGAGAGAGYVEIDPFWSTSGHATITDAQIQQAIQNGLLSGTFPPPQPGTIYNFYFPRNVTINAGGSSCSDFCGYHADTNVLVPNVIPDAGTSDAGGDAGDGGDAATDAGLPMGTRVDVAYSVIANCDLGVCWANDAFQQMTISASHELAEASSDPSAPTTRGSIRRFIRSEAGSRTATRARASSRRRATTPSNGFGATPRR
jgi:hypothetical protein